MRRIWFLDALGFKPLGSPITCRQFAPLRRRSNRPQSHELNRSKDMGEYLPEVTVCISVCRFLLLEANVTDTISHFAYSLLFRMIPTIVEIV